MFSTRVKKLLADPASCISVLTGAGISAESGIPTFRGPEGYWTVGSRVYMPQEIATFDMFSRHPREVWEWHLFRLGVCLHAEPNAGHRALAEMERRLGDRFILITQNIDNLHILAGNSFERTFQIHGNINFTRCARECGPELRPLREKLRVKREAKDLSEEEIAMLHCPRCGGWLRPHVLWFDELYDEEHFRFDSAVAAASRTDLLIIAGTSGATTLPNHVAAIVYGNGGTIVDINIERDPFAALGESSPGGCFLQCPAAGVLPALAELAQETSARAGTD